jgi:hypothetical protein
MAQQEVHSSHKEWQGAFAAFSTALKRMGENTDFLVLFLGLYAVASIISGLVQDNKSSYSHNYMGVEDVVTFVFILALMNYELTVASNKKKTISELLQFNLFKFLSLIAAYILVGAVVGISFLLLIVPVVWAVGWFALSAYAVVDQHKGPIEAMKESKRISKDHKGKVWGLVGVYILILIPASILAAIPYVGPVATGFAMVWSICAFASLYRWLQAQSA